MTAPKRLLKGNGRFVKVGRSALAGLYVTEQKIRHPSKSMVERVARAKTRQDLDVWTDADEAEAQRQIAVDPDAPEITDAQASRPMTFAEALPELAASIKRSRGRPTIEQPKQPISLRLSPDVIEAFRATGKGWQTRIDEALRKAAGL